MRKKLVIETVSEHNHGDSQEYLCLAYENSWGAGLAKNQLQFIADQINSGKIALPNAEPDAEHERPKRERLSALDLKLCTSVGLALFTKTSTLMRQMGVER